MPGASRLQPDNRSYAALSTPGSDAEAGRDGCAASARGSRCVPQPPTRPAGTPWHALPPTLSNPPATQVSAVGCMDAAQTPLQPPGARAQSGLFAPGGACGAVVLASTSMAATRLQPTGSTSASSPVASSLDVPSATTSRPGLRCRQGAFGPCPRCLFSSATHWSQATFRSPCARLATAPQAPS